MRIGILTFHFALNYGAVIQAWALSQYLTSLRHDVRIINYNPAKTRLPWWIRMVLHRQWQSLYRALKFMWFRRMHLKETKAINNVQNIESLNLGAIIVGSDQVWNVDFFKQKDGKFNSVYFLEGVSTGAKKIAYAASMGEALQLDYRWREELIQALEAFDARLVRENLAKKELEKLGVPSEWVIDPTLLVNPNVYDELTSKENSEKPYLFSYLLTQIDDGLDLCEQYRKLNPCDLRFVTLRQVKNRNLVLPSPKQWLALLRNAKFVITDSFHGVALSIAFNAPFAVLLKSMPTGQNSRIIELLERIGLTDRIINPKSLDAGVFAKEINWGTVNERIGDFRGLSSRRLGETIKGRLEKNKKITEVNICRLEDSMLEQTKGK